MGRRYEFENSEHEYYCDSCTEDGDEAKATHSYIGEEELLFCCPKHLVHVKEAKLKATKL